MFDRYIYNIEKRAKEIVNDLSVFDLCYAIKQAKKDYYFGTGQNNDTDFTGIKNLLSLGFSPVYRVIKANNRLPKIDEINTNNVRQVLAEILLGEGGTNPRSLKYLIVSRLFFEYNQVSTAYANSLVEAILRELLTHLSPTPEVSGLEEKSVHIAKQQKQVF